MNRYPFHPGRLTEVLDGEWDFAWLGDADLDGFDPEQVKFDETAAVPGCFDTAGARIGQRGAAVYHTRFEFPAGLARLTFGGLGLYARIYFDNVLLEEVRTPYATIGCELRCDGGFHDLTVLADNRFGDESRVPIFKPYADFYGFGGIYRSVKIEQLPELFLDRVKVETVDLASGRVRLKPVLGCTGAEPETLAFRVRFDEGAWRTVTAPVTDGVAEFEAEVPDFRIWSPASPALHTVTVAIDGDSIVERFGIRTVSTRGQQILLNGEPIRLLGVNRHESHPNFGPVQPTQLMVDDLKWAKELNANFIRGAHYQQNPEFLELCDRMGFLVWNESLGWNQPESDAKNPETARLLLESTATMVRESFNNPSVIFYGFCNESCSDTPGGRELYRKLAETIREEDSTRLISYASNKFERDLCFDLADVISINPYPGWISQVENWVTVNRAAIRPAFDRHAAYFSSKPEYAGKPLLISESGACGIFGIRDRMRAQWSEEFQSDYFDEAVRAVLDNPRYCGTTLWQMIDCRSYVNVGAIRCKPRGYNSAGLLDEYRRPKLAFDTVRELFARYRK